MPRLLKWKIDLRALLFQARNQGYAFATRAIGESWLGALQMEIQSLPLEREDRVREPINQGSPKQVVQQFHGRAYRPIGHSDVPLASRFADELADHITEYGDEFPELRGWRGKEIGYQSYRDATDHISPHRDRASDQLLSATVTLAGRAVVRIHRSLVEPPDYNQLALREEFLTGPGTLMLLRAPGFGSGERIIHEVLPPLERPRDILNLRQRDDVLKSAAERTRQSN